MDKGIKELFEELLRVFRTSETLPGVPKDIHGVDRTLRMDLAKYAMFLSSSDGNVVYQEASIVSELLDMELSTEFIKEFVEEHNIYSKEFKNTLPVSVRWAIETDNTVYRLKGSTGKADLSLAVILYQMYKYIGLNVLSSDGDVDSQEVEDYEYYNDMIRNRIKDDILFASIVPMLKKADDEIEKNQNVKYYNSVENNINRTEQDTSVDLKDNDEESLEDLIEELNTLTGLEQVKYDVKSLINLLRVSKLRESRGLNPIPLSLHLVFYGNPGTGKTTVARLLARIYKSLGIISKGHLVETDRAGLVGGYVGQTAIKTQEKIDEALGGVLFIDEAYTLYKDDNQGDYGQEAIDTILKGMEDHRNDLIVIVAGYPDLMNDFLNSNPGLRSRFNKYVNFEDYTPNELTKIFFGMCQKGGFSVTKDCIMYVRDVFVKRCKNKDAYFANAREARNLFENSIIKQANRLATNLNVSDQELSTLKKEDVKD